MRLATVATPSGERLAFGLDKGLVTVARLSEYQGQAGAYPERMEEVLADSSRALDRLAPLYEWAATVDLRPEDLVPSNMVRPPVTRPEKIICVGLNYRPHVEESRMPIPEYPVLFNKFNNALRGAGEPVKVPGTTQKMDYEAELVMVIGRRCQNVSADQALDYVLGYTNGNDLSARDLQFRTGQWLLGKALDGFAPVGPYLVTDRINPDALDIRCLVNGVERQHDNTGNMIFSCRFLIEYLSRHFTLQPGDLIFTGTPQGVIMGLAEDEQVWLRPGDEVVVEIEGLGRLVTPLV